jgi:hypothetical protein
MWLHWTARCALLGLGTAAISLAQTFPLQLIGTSNGIVLTIQNGEQIPFAVSVGQTQALGVTATYAGSGTIKIPADPTLVFGSSAFTATLSAALPITLSPGASFSFTIVFKPTSAAEVTALFTLPFTETVPGTGSGSTPTVTANSINLNLIGTAPSYIVSYTKDSNVIEVANGGAISFDPQPINTTVTLTLNITDNGSANGQVNNIVVSGDKAFQLVGRPLLPASVQSGDTLQVGIEYMPTAVGSDTGQVQITFGDGTTQTFVLQGSSTAPTLVYTLSQNGKTTTVTPPGPITLPNTNVGSTSSLVVRVQNTGNGTATVSSLSAAAPFEVTGAPLFPQTLTPSGSFQFTLTFAPTQPGVQNSQLLVGNDLFNLTGTGLGSNLQFSYTAAGSTLTIGTNGVTSVVFSPVQVTQTASIPFTVTNTGTLPAVISNIAIQGATSPFSVSGLPALPKTLGPGASVSFTVIFSPTTATLVGDALIINSTAIPLSGKGTAPPPLPAYTISGPTGNVAPQSQPTVTLSLASPYPVEIDGVLSVTTSGTSGIDQAVQFITGGVTVPFTIPANSTEANFAGQGNQIQLQTGTVANTITLTPTFTTAGGISLTPSNPTTLQFTVPSQAPVLISVTIASSNANSIVLSISGYSTTRSLTTLNAQFTAAAGFSLAATPPVDLTQAATAYFDGTASQGFGGQFTVSVPFTFSGTPPIGTELVQTIASVSVTISNSVGTSNAVTTPIQ